MKICDFVKKVFLIYFFSVKNEKNNHEEKNNKSEKRGKEMKIGIKRVKNWKIEKFSFYYFSFDIYLFVCL